AQVPRPVRDHLPAATRRRQLRQGPGHDRGARVLPGRPEWRLRPPPPRPGDDRVPRPSRPPLYRGEDPGMRRLALCAVAALAMAAAPALAATEPQTSLPDVADEVMCTVCGVLLDEAPDAPQAERERAFIQREINQGKTKDQIEDDLVAEYGPQVLAEPGTSGFDLAAWVVPAGAILLAGLGILIALRR